MIEELSPNLHPREGPRGRYVYVVRSRRAGGLSVGINLDPQKTCNFDCVYCEVIDRHEGTRRRSRPRIDPEEVAAELEVELRLLSGGGEPVRDVAFAGDGEPSTFPGFLELSRRVLDVRDAAGLSIPVILITNGSGLDRSEMREAHDLFAARGGMFWIKLDAGTEEFYRKVCRTAVSFPRVLRNLREAAGRHPVVVQSMLFRQAGTAPPKEEVEELAARIGEIAAGGGRIQLVQVYTVARETMEPGIEPLSIEELEEAAWTVRRRAPGVPVTVFP